MTRAVRTVARVLAALAIVWIAGLVVLAASGCGVPKPPPNVPPGEIGCPEACDHVANDLPLCGTSKAGCLDACNDIARNNPRYPTCLGASASCASLSECDAP